MSILRSNIDLAIGGHRRRQSAAQIRPPSFRQRKLDGGLGRRAARRVMAIGGPIGRVQGRGLRVQSLAKGRSAHQTFSCSGP